MEEYIDKLLSQIRCKKARPYIEKEIRGHIEDQALENMSNGMTKDEATVNAVKDMGDPIEVGISMDKIHKPMIAWKMLLIVGIISVFAILVQWRFVLNINNNIANYGSITHATQVDGVFTSDGGVIENIMDYYYSIGEFVRDIIVGFIVMSLLYFLDYTFIAKYARIIGCAMVMCGLYTVTLGVEVNGAHYYIMNIPVSAASFMMMYIPVYGAILYKHRGGGTGAIFKCIVWSVVPVFITLRIPNVMVAGIMMICMLVQLTIAVCKGWFNVNKKICVASLWMIFMLLPIIALWVMASLHMIADYQMARLRSWFSLNGETSYLIMQVRAYTNDINWFGKSTKDIMGQIPDLNRDYVFTYVINTYGSIAGMVVIAVLAVLILCIFGAAIRQKNELGLVMGTGCGMIILMNTVINIGGAIGILPPASSFLPFFSAGGSNLILCYAFIGIVMSIYRYKNVYPKHRIMDNKEICN